MVVPVMSPADLLGLQMLNLGLRRDSGANILMRARQPLVSAKRTRRQRRGLRAHGQRGGPGSHSNGKFQKAAAFHDVSLFGFGK